MTVENHAAQATCCGCCLNPGFINPFGPYINPNPFTNDPLLYNTLPSPFQQQTFQASTFITANDFTKLTPEERELLQKLGESYNLYCSLDKRSESDNREFTDAIHRLQQLVALRVARRVDPEVWAQPE